MKRNHWGRKLTAMLLAVMLLAGMMSAVAEQAAEGEAAVVADLTAGQEAEPVLLASVNGDEIWSNNEDMQSLISYYNSYYGSSGYDTSDPSLQAYLRAAGLEWAIESVLYRQKAKELNVEEMTDEQRAALEVSARTDWDGVVDYYAQNLSGLTEESTEEEKAAARENALSYIETNFGYTEDKYVQEFVESSREGQMRQNVQKAVLGEITVSDEDVISYFNSLVEEDRKNYEGNIPMYEYYTNYMGSDSYYVPEGYRGITHILLDVDDELMKTYSSLTAEMEEQKEKEKAEENTAETAETTEETAATTEETAAETAEQPAEAAKETAAETAEQPAEAAKETAAETADQPAEETAETAEQPAEETAAETENAEEEKKEPVTQEQVDAAKQAILDSVQAQVDEIMAKYAAGTPFADLIAEYGTDPGMTREPNKTNGYAVHADSILWDPAFTAGAMGLKNVGDVSEPVLGSSGIHILHYTRDIPAGAVEFTEEMRAKLSEELLSDKENTAVMAMMDGWKAAAEIVYTEEGQAILDAAHQEDDASVETTEATEEVLSEGE